MEANFITTDRLIMREGEELSDLLICSICTGILYDPLECISCQRATCKSCLNKLNPIKCPFCRNEEFKTAHLQTKRNLENLKFKCPNQCRNEINYEYFFKHDDICGDKIIECPFKSCKEVFKRKDFVNHKLSCNSKMINCIYCGISLKSIEYKVHLDNCEYANFKEENNININYNINNNINNINNNNFPQKNEVINKEIEGEKLNIVNSNANNIENCNNNIKHNDNEVIIHNREINIEDVNKCGFCSSPNYLYKCYLCKKELCNDCQTNNLFYKFELDCGVRSKAFFFLFKEICLEGSIKYQDGKSIFRVWVFLLLFIFAYLIGTIFFADLLMLILIFIYVIIYYIIVLPFSFIIWKICCCGKRKCKKCKSKCQSCFEFEIKH
jgi:hypothetical protein